MGKSELKLKLHSLVERINDEMILLNFYNAFASFDNEQQKDSYQLTEEQSALLEESLTQYKNGDTVSDNEVRKQISSWLGK